MRNKFLLTLTPAATDELAKLMAEDLQDSRSQYLSRLIAEERRRRELKKVKRTKSK